MKPWTAPPPFLPAHYYSDRLAASGSPKSDSAQATVALNLQECNKRVGYKSRVAQLELLASRRAGLSRELTAPATRVQVRVGVSLAAWDL